MRDGQFRILYVEDDADVRPAIEHVLLAQGYKVDVAETYAKAIKLLNSGAIYDLVLTDGRLADGNGIDIADKAKARGIKAVVVTGYAFQFPAKDLARHVHVWKPVRAAELLALVARCLESENPR